MDLFGNKNDKNQQQKHVGSSVQRDVTQDVAICINSMGITSSPILKFLEDDGGISDGVFISHMTNPQVEIIKQTYGNDVYLRILGCHALGAGAYVALCQYKYDKAASEFTTEECLEIRNAFAKTDPYELALNELGFPVDGNNKKCLDKIVTVGIQSYKSSAKAQILDKDLLQAFMQTMYNAGVTVALRG